MMLLVVNYHYIGDEGRFESGIHPVSVARLEKQVAALGAAFSFVGMRDVLDAMDGKRSLPERAALVTFDDTLREQYTDALPVLDRLGIPAVFFANGLPYAEQKALEIHKVHWLRAHIPANEFLQMLARHVTEITGIPFDMAVYPVSEEELRQRYKYGDLAELRVRHLLYAGLPRDVRSAVIERMFAEAAGDEKDFCGKTYIPASGLRDLASRGFLGIHGYGHYPLGTLSPEEQRKELEHCVTAVAEASGMPERRFAAISYSYGTPDAVTPDVAALAAALGFRIGFTMERAINRTFLDPLRMARVDANDIPEGKNRCLRYETGTYGLPRHFSRLIVRQKKGIIISHERIGQKISCAHSRARRVKKHTAEKHRGSGRHAASRARDCRDQKEPVCRPHCRDHG